MKVVLVSFLLGLVLPVFPMVVYADTGIYGNDAPDVILCHTIDGDIQAATPPYKDVGGNIYYNFPSTGFLEYDSSTGDYVDGDAGGYTTDCQVNYHTILSDGRAFYYVQTGGVAGGGGGSLVAAGPVDAPHVDMSAVGLYATALGVSSFAYLLLRVVGAMLVGRRRRAGYEMSA